MAYGEKAAKFLTTYDKVANYKYRILCQMEWLVIGVNNIPHCCRHENTTKWSCYEILEGLRSS